MADALTDALALLLIITAPLLFAPLLAKLGAWADSVCERFCDND